MDSNSGEFRHAVYEIYISGMIKMLSYIKYLAVFVLLTQCAYAVEGGNVSTIDGKTTIDDLHILIIVSLVFVLFSFALMKIAGSVSSISIISMGLSSILLFYIAQVYNNGTLIVILPNSQIAQIYNNATSQFWQFVALVTMGLTIIQIVVIIFASKKPIFTINEDFGDGLK